MKGIISTVVLLIVGTTAEPPVDRSYLAPQYRTTDPDSFSPPPGAGYQRQTDALISPRAPSSSYGAPGRLEAPSATYGTPKGPSAQYGAPSYQQREPPSSSYGAPERQYLPANLRDDGSDGEPANYSFEYAVKDDASGNDFGHRESRMGDRAEGVYYVLLPDGRKQTVQYEADENGYRPKISYEDAGTYGRSSAGYPSGPY